jgi:hypothetical protein
MNDLWSFNGSQWTWVSGSSSANQVTSYSGTTMPGSRYGATSWSTSDNHLWLFGGYGFTASSIGLLNDLWEFNGTQWTWMAGSNTVSALGVYGTQGSGSVFTTPGGRTGASGATYNNVLYLFGGTGESATGYGMLSDLWSFSNGKWTWLAGSSVNDASGRYLWNDIKEIVFGDPWIWRSMVLQ